MGYQVINKGKPDYPTRLLNIESFTDEILHKEFNPPEKLYIDGARPDLLNTQKTISIVGTRSPFYKAFEIGELVGKLAASNGIVIVSGYATGIDTTGHL